MSATFEQRVQELFPDPTGPEGPEELAICLAETFQCQGRSLTWLYRYVHEHSQVPVAYVIGLVKRSSEQDLWSNRIISQNRTTFCPVEYR